MRHSFLMVWAGVLCLFAGTVVYLELRPLLAQRASFDVRFEAYAVGAESLGLSARSHDLVLHECLLMVTSIEGRLKVPALRAQVLARCESDAIEITRRTPTHGFGWFTQALVAAETGQIETMNEGLAQSRRAGPNEQWIAEVCVALSERNYAALSETNRAGNDQDLLMLIQSERGVRTLARRYIQQPDFRARITTLVETLPEEAQQKFVVHVRTAATELGLL